VFGQNVTEHNPAPSPSGHPLLSGPPTLNDIHQIFTRYSPSKLAGVLELYAMVLHLVGVGLGDEQDITLKGLNALKRCSKIYLEAYTSVLTVPKEQLEEAWGVVIEIADRQLCEEGCEEAILQRAMTEEVALLVVGDPFGATTHSDLLHRAREMAVPSYADTYAPAPPYCAYGLRTVRTDQRQQGSSPPGPHALRVRRSRASLRRAVRTTISWHVPGHPRCPRT